MKKYIILVCFTWLRLVSSSQNVVQVEYYIDADAGSGYGNNTLINVTPTEDGSFPLMINLPGLLPGYHKLYIRTKDSDGKWSLTARRNIEVLASQSKTSIVNGEYFIDNDPGFGNGMTITITSADSVILQNFTAVTSGLSKGFHKLYGRFKDNEGRWGLTFRRNMEVYADEINAVIKGEYFFTADQGIGNCATSIFSNPSVDGSFALNIPLNEIPQGADTLFVRVQDSEGKWCITQLKDVSAPLPLTLLSFKAARQNNYAQLKWQTSNEINTAYFNIQRSTDGINFTGVGKVSSKISNSMLKDYIYADDIGGLDAGKLYYRLQMKDNDGMFTLSDIVFVDTRSDGTPFTISPNPADDYFIFSGYDNTDVSNTSIVIRDMAGRMHLHKRFTGAGPQKINIASLAKGLYLVSITKRGNVHTQKLLVK